MVDFLAIGDVIGFVVAWGAVSTIVNAGDTDGQVVKVFLEEHGALQWRQVCFGLAGVEVALRRAFLSAASRDYNAELTSVWIMVTTVASSLVSVALLVVSIVEVYQWSGAASIPAKKPCSNIDWESLSWLISLPSAMSSDLL